MEGRRTRLLFVVAWVTATLLLASGTAVGVGSSDGAVQVAAPTGVDGEVVAYGSSQLLLIRHPYEGQSGITRINLDGSVDHSFGGEGTVAMAAEDAIVTRGGKILVSGSSNPTGGKRDARVTRLLPDGRPDATFGVAGSADVDFGGRYDNGQRLALTAHGQILLAGYRQRSASSRGETNSSPAVARLRPDGSLDRSFGRKGVRVFPGGGETAVLDIASTPDGGAVVNVGNEAVFALLKLTHEGSVDSEFGKRGWLEVRGKREKYGYHEELFVTPQLAVLPSGKLLLAATGYPNRGPDVTFRVVAVRLHPDGRVDRSYGDDGWAVAGKGPGWTFAEGLTLLPGGVLAIATSFAIPPYEQREFGAVAFGPDGRLERRFGKQGRCRARLAGEQEALGVAALGRRAAVMGYGDDGPWLLNCPALRRR
jgi:uncharacterized delta-60 repeat protein